MNERVTEVFEAERYGIDGRIAVSQLVRPFEAIKLDLSEIGYLKAVFDEAFRNAPHFKYLLPDPVTRSRVLPSLLGSMTDFSSGSGELYATENFDGAAFWIRPGEVFPFKQLAHAGVWSFPSASKSAAFARRCRRLAGRMQSVHSRLLSTPHWYLVAMGIRESLRESGIADGLLQPVLSQADAMSLPCYVEVFREDDICIFYESGFRVQGAGCIPCDGPDYWVMVRPPARRRPLFN